jgi:hypothetical protein
VRPHRIRELAENVISPLARNGGFDGTSDSNGGLTGPRSAWVRTRSGSTTAFPPAALSACGIQGGSPDLDFISPPGDVSDPQPGYGLTFTLASRAGFGQGEVTIADPTCAEATLAMTATRLSGAQPRTGSDALAGRGGVR